MRPAFSSLRRAAAFSALILATLLLPAFLGKSLLPDRRHVYSSIAWSFGGFPYIEQQLFEEKGDIDIAFVSGSMMFEGIDTPYVQEQLSQRLGRPAVVRSLCWNWQGTDALY